MTSQDSFSRRICAVLLADVSGFSALMGEDDERTARAVQDLQTLVQGITAEAHGTAEPVAGDSIFATFDSVVAAVEAALTIQRRVAAAEFAGKRLQIRIGIDFGDLLLREGVFFGDAINVASRLQQLAQPGTICISEGVHRHVRNKLEERFVDLGRQHLKNIDSPVRAYLVVPRDTADVRLRGLRRPASPWGIRGGIAAAVAALAIVAAVAVQRQRAAQPGAPTDAVQGEATDTTSGRDGVAPPARGQEQVALGVMSFEPLGKKGERAWMGEALRDVLNAQLSQLSSVRVYSKEFIDFLITRKGLSDIEAATQLGITKMLKGSFVTIGTRMQIEMHVVDVSSGVLESSYSQTYATTGGEREFLALQDQMVHGVIARLDLPVTAEEREQLLAHRSTNVESVKLLLEAERGPSQRSAPTDGEPRSALPIWLGQLVCPAVAWAQEAPGAGDSAEAEEAIRALIERYRQATEAEALADLADIYAEFRPDQEGALRRYFENVRDLRIGIEDIDIAVVGDEAVASYTRTDDFVDEHTGRTMHVAVRLTKLLRQENGAWKLAMER